MKDEKAQIYNQFFTEEKWEKVNRYNKRLLDDFILEKKSLRKSSGTLKQYKNNLRILFIYILEECDNVPIYELKRKDFRDYSLFLQDKGMAPRTVNSKLSAMRSMLAYAEDDNDYSCDIKVNYGAKIKGLQNEDVREIVFLTMEEVDMLRNYFIENNMYMDAALISVLIDTGARKNEVNQVLKKTITDDGKFTNIVVGKRGKKFKLLYNRYTKESVKEYLKHRGEDNCEYLWVDEDGKVLGEKDIYNIVCGWRKILYELTGEYKKFNVHSFRHTTAELLVTGEHYICKELGDKKFDINQVRILLNHSSSSTTEGYIKDRSEEELLDAFGLN